MSTQSDDIAALAQLLVRQYVRTGIAAQLRQSIKAGSNDPLGLVASAAGTTGAVVMSWERGELEPTTGQAIAWLAALERLAARRGRVDG